jgi:hypothetical protein
METGSLVANLDAEISDPLAFFACDAERALSALFHSVRDSHGEKAAFCVAEGWLEELETELVKCENELPKLSQITRRSIAWFFTPSSK